MLSELAVVCVKSVDKQGKAFGQTINLITAIHNSLLKILHSAAHMCFVYPTWPQGGVIFAQDLIAKLPLLRVYFYPLSTNPIAANKLNKGLLI